MKNEKLIWDIVKDYKTIKGLIPCVTPHKNKIAIEEISNHAKVYSANTDFGSEHPRWVIIEMKISGSHRFQLLHANYYETGIGVVIPKDGFAQLLICRELWRFDTLKSAKTVAEIIHNEGY